MPYLRHYSERILNPFSGTIQIVEFDNTRAICTDGIHWHLQILNEIVQKPWSALRVQGDSSHYLKYGSWSKSSGLNKIPVHPTLYQENVEQRIALLIKQLQVCVPTLPFTAQDKYECWLFDPDNNPVVLLKSSIDQRNLSIPNQAQWYPCNLNDNGFKSEFAEPHQHAQDMLSKIVLKRVSAHPTCAWIKRDEHGYGHVIKSSSKKLVKNHPIIANEFFPELMVSTQWNDNTNINLVKDYLAWQAPVLLTLATLSDKTRRSLEINAQQHPEAVEKFHRLYPNIIDTKLLNKILVEATMRKALL